MALANVALTDTFNVWRVRTNQLVIGYNLFTEGLANTTGTLTISNPAYLNGNVSLNVSNGVIRVKSNVFDANAITFTSNSSILVVSGTGRLGTTVYLNVANLSNNIYDTSSSNIASANSAHEAFKHANAAYNTANTKLANANGVVFSGDLNISGNVNILGGYLNLL